MEKHFDVIVIGSGIAGLTFAVKLASRGHRVGIITKKNKAESNTNYAQGGIASVTSQTDDFELHVRDTLEAGDGLCDEAVVREIVRDGPARIRELAELGVAFSHLDDGRVSLHREGGHSKRRILHVADFTGKAIEEALLHAIAEDERITLFEHYFAIDLITRRRLLKRGLETSAGGSDAVVGLYALDTLSGKVEAFRARAVMLATGGAGQVYLYTSNPSIATGDGIAMAYRAGVEVQNMEFIQFHPTTLYTRTEERFLISEAVRGEGGILLNARKKPFMRQYHPKADLAPRDVVARAIDAEMKKSGARHLWLDLRHLPADHLRKRFPSIYEACRQQGVDITQDLIPVVPAAHYLCGGVATNLAGETSLPGLYACGEVACTGLHGANRLASNSLLEAVVMASRGATAVQEYLQTQSEEAIDIPVWVDGHLQDSDERVVLYHNWDELKRTLWDYVGIVRSTKRLERAQKRITNLAHEITDYYWNFKVETDLLELRNLVAVAEMIVSCAMQRKESRGLHYTLDYPDKHPDPRHSSVRR